MFQTLAHLVGTPGPPTDADDVARVHWVTTPDAMMASGVVPEQTWTPGKTMPKLVPIERDYTQVGCSTAWARSWKRLAYCQGRCVQRSRGFEELGDLNGRPHGRQRREGALCDCDQGGEHGDAFLRAPRTLAGRPGLPHARKRVITPWHSWLEGRGKKITYRDTAPQPRSVINSPEWSGLSTVVAATAPSLQNDRVPQAVARSRVACSSTVDHD